MNAVDISVKKKKSEKIYQYYGAKKLSAGLLFLVGVIGGVILVCYTMAHLDNIKMMQIVNVEDLNMGVSTFKEIFINNIIVAMIMCCGIFYGRLIPKFVILVNGLMCGVVIGSYLFVDSSIYILLSLLPHAILEIPLLIFCASFGMNKYKKFTKKEYGSLILFLLIGFALAAIIEVNISYKIALYFQ